MPDPKLPTSERIRRFAAHARVLAVVYFLALFIGTHLPPGEIGPPNFSDKLAHFGAYAILAVLILAVWELSTGRLRPRHFFAVWLAGTVYAAFDEWTQIPVGRTCDMNDWFADVAGIVIGIIAYQLLRPLLFALLGHPHESDA